MHDSALFSLTERVARGDRGRGKASPVLERSAPLPTNKQFCELELGLSTHVVCARDGKGCQTAALVVVALAFLFRCAFLMVLYDGDTELFVYMGKLVNDGGRMGIDLIDNKLPTVGLLMSVPQRWLGASWTGYGLLSIALAVASVAMLARAARVVRPSSQWPAAALGAVWVCFPIAVFAAFKLEHFTLFTSALGGLAVVNCWKTRDWRDAFLLGLVAGTGAMAKPSALAVLAAAFVLLPLWRGVGRERKTFLAAAALTGAAVPAVVCLIYLVQTNSIPAAVALFQQTSAYAKNAAWQWDVIAWKALTIALLFGVPIGMRWWGERRAKLPTLADESELHCFVALWFAIELLAIVMQGRMYGYHFLPLAAPATLAFALVPRRPSALAIVGSALPVLLVSAAWTWFAVLATAKPVDRLAAIDYVKCRADSRDAVWMDDIGRLMAESDLKPGSRVPLTFIFSNHDQAPAQFSRVLLDDFAARHPRWLVMRNDQPARVEYLCTVQAEFVAHPRRADNLRRAWADIEAYVGKDYIERQRFGELTVFERRQSP